MLVHNGIGYETVESFAIALNADYAKLKTERDALIERLKRHSEERDHYRQECMDLRVAVEIRERNAGEMTFQLRDANLQVRELWALIDSIPSGPGDGMVALSEDINEGLNWADRYRAAKARWKPVAQKPKCVCDRCKKEFNDNDSNWCLACRKESHESMEKRICEHKTVPTFDGLGVRYKCQLCGEYISE